MHWSRFDLYPSVTIDLHFHPWRPRLTWGPLPRPEMHFMLRWNACRRLLPALILLTVASCRPATDAGIDPVPPLPATMLVIGPFAQQGMGFLVDRQDRLVVVSAHTVGSKD